jgi:DNA-binding response OmpR family regulator
MLPMRGGLELLRKFRERGQRAPVVLLTARSDESDKVLGLELGADDYVTKPFGVRELLARIKVQLRRQQQLAGAEAESVETAFRIGTVDVDLGAYQLRRDGVVHGLSPKEAALLGLLWRELGQAVARNRILDEVWGQDQFVGHRTVDTHVLNLRKKLEADPAKPRHLLTVHGVGYRLVATAPAP